MIRVVQEWMRWARIDPVGVAMPGTRLTDRVRQIVSGSAAGRISRGRMIGIVAACLVLCAAFFAVALTRAQSNQAAAAPLPSFEVVSIKPTRDWNARGGNQITQNGFSATGLTTKFLLMIAYRVMPFQIVGGPSWIDSEHYDIDAKEDEATGAKLQKLSSDQRMDQIGLMLQSLLLKRFKLVVKHETSEEPVYSLVVSKAGRIREDEGDCDAATNPGDSPDAFCGGLIAYPGHTSGQKVPLSALVNQLAATTQRIVMDNTGLTGKYDITLNWTPDPGQTGAPLPPGVSLPKPDPNGPSLAAALGEQLGLKLVSTKGPVDTIVIDHIEKPTPN